jgi:anti-sigma factor RsiW
MNCTEISTLSPLYISGELDTARAAAFTAHLKSCPACAAELARHIEMDRMLRAGVLAEELDTSALDSRVHTQIAASEKRRRAVSRRWLAVAACIVIGLIIAGLTYRAFVSRPTAQVYADAARDHRNEVTYKQPRRWLVDQAEIEMLAMQQGLRGATVVAFAPSGYHLEHGKLCRLDGRVFLHLVYSDQGHEFSLFLRRGDGNTMPGKPRETVNGLPLYTADRGDDHLACFQNGHLAAMVVGDQSSEAVLQIARFAARVL